jgi:4a-hydroxytetrahydrobiopterin dehydratase
MAINKLTDTEAQEKLLEVPGWTISGNHIEKGFKFKTYLDSVDFVQKVGLKAESIDHHPRIIVEYGKTTIEIHTHSVDGITALDFKLAKMIDSIFHKF